MTRVTHLFPDTRNIGDHFVQRGILRLLGEHLDQLDYSTLPARDEGTGSPFGITAATIDRLNAADLLVIGGSNLYEAWGDGWGVEVDDEALAALQVPVLLVGIGSGWSFAFPSYPNLGARAVRQITRLHRNAMGSSVRDHLTARVLRAHGIAEPSVTGCPAAFLGEYPLQPVRRGTIGVPFLPRRMYAARTLNPRRWRSPTYRHRRLMTDFFLSLLAGLRSRGADVRVMVHDANDLPLANELLGTAFEYADDPQRTLDSIAACDVVVGFRLHAAIAALAFGVPCIPVLADGRSMGFAETLRVAELAVPVDARATGAVLERIDMALGSQRRAWEPAFERRDELRGRMREFFAHSLDRVGRGSLSGAERTGPPTYSAAPDL